MQKCAYDIPYGNLVLHYDTRDILCSSNKDYIFILDEILKAL